MGKGKGKINDRAYIKASEYSQDGWGGKIAKIENVEQPIPFDYCCLSLQPFKNPVGTDKGYIYDLEEIVEWLKEHKIDPCTGEKLSPKDLITLKFEKNEKGNFHCPTTGKEFNKFTHIVAIRTSGNVYSYEAVKKLNIDTKNWNDLISGEPFTKKDIITIQDKEDNRFRLASNFYYLKNKMRFQKDETRETDPSRNVNLSMTNLNIIKKVTESLPKENKKPNIESFRKTDSAAFTSSSYNPSLKEETVIEKKTEKKGYVQLITNMGTIDLELHCDLTPNTCLNFLTHCENGYYNGTIFHRSIKNFMVQGGDPEGTGKGGKSIWGKDFKDEIVPSLKHDGIGVLSMANRGKDTNGSQFFITYKSAKHLDGKHTVFGRVIDNYETLKKIENIPTDSTDRPLQQVKIESVDVVYNPLSNEELKKEKEEKEEKEKHLKKLEEEKQEKGKWFSNPSGLNLSENKNSTVIGKYINTSNINKPKVDKKRSLNFDNVIKTQNKKPKKQYGDFSNW